jgi:hypothetical protein
MLVIAATRRLGTRNSNGTTASCPYTNLNGVCPVNFLHVVLYAHSTAGIFQRSTKTLGMGGRGYGETHKGDVWKYPPNFRDFWEMGDEGTSHI